MGRRLELSVVAVSLAVAVLGLVSVVLGFVAEDANSKAFVGYDGTYCVYRRTAALNCGVAAAAFLLAGLVVLGAASGGFGRCGEAGARTYQYPPRRRRNLARMDIIFWTVTAMAMSAFLYGAWRNAGGRKRNGPTGGRYSSSHDCPKSHDVFNWAASTSGIPFVFGIAAYVSRETAETEQLQATSAGIRYGEDAPPTVDILAQLAHYQPHQEYIPRQQPPVFQPQQAYPASDPPPPYGAYGAKAPAAAGTS